MDVMKAIRIYAYGGPEQLRSEDAPVPQPSPGQVLVRVHASSVNPWDYKLASGVFREQVPLNFPYIPGGEFSGIVEAVSPGVGQVKAGEAVFGNCPLGAYAQFVAAPAESVAPKPRTLTHPQSASVPVAGQTAWQALFDHGHLQAGQTVLIHGAAGGVGSFAVQLARWKGAKVIATASASNVQYLQSLGADQVIDYKSTPFDSVARGVDLVLDLVGGETQTRSFPILKQGGYLVATAQLPSQDLAAKYKVHAVMMGMKASTANLLRLAELLDAGKLRTEVAKIFPLTQVKDAWEYTKSSHARGKVVLEVPV